MDNRFLPEPARRARSPNVPPHRREARYGSTVAARPLSIDGRGLARVQSAAQRVLVVLIENRGVDLGIPELADKLLTQLPGASLLPEDLRQRLIGFLRKTIEGFTDHLLESAELALNRYGGAKPTLYGEVVVLRDGTATHDQLRDTLWKHTREERLVDLLILTHGGDRSIDVDGGVTDEKIRRMRADLGRPLAIRSVYMMNCIGASLNQAWLDAGAKVSSGSIRNNYLPEPTTFFFWQHWKDGQGFESAVTAAYRKTVNALNDAVRGFVSALPGGGLVAGQIDFETMEFVRDSAPVIQGQRSVTIASDDLSFANSLSSSLATTVLPVHLIGQMALSRAASLRSGTEVSHSFCYVSPSTTMQPPEGLSRMQNPAAAAPVAAAVAWTDAAQVGLAAAGVVQSQANATVGSFTLLYDKAQRLLSADARRRMPGAQQARTKYQRQLMYIAGGALVAQANATIIIEWEGNPYGEIGTVQIRRDLGASTDWSKSSASLNITRIERIPLPNTDPRTWPIAFGYEGQFDPLGNGHFEFSGEFEINAFGALKFVRHVVVSRSLVDFAVIGKPEEYVQKGMDVWAATPDIPADQLKFLNENLP